jgi:SAM-dependent methyltransferase
MPRDVLAVKREWSEPLTAIAGAIACPQCQGELEPADQGLQCTKCGAAYIIRNGVVDLRPGARQDHGEDEAWSRHWDDANQTSIVQRFFSFYRKAVFARAVAYFVDHYFPRTGLILEAGSGTSETSMRVHKAKGRTLVALDLIPGVLERCHPVMDVRVAGDIFRLPFQSDSVDGIWNVGVMEHFTHDQIDEIMREFYRVLRPGARIILFWPGTDSLPQKMLRVPEFMIGLVKGIENFHFHPEEISQLRSVAHGREVLARTGFDTVHGDAGLRSAFAFKVMVGAKPVGAQVAAS